MLTGKVANPATEVAVNTLSFNLKGEGDAQLPVESDEITRRAFFGKLQAGQEIPVLGRCNVSPRHERYEIGLDFASRPDFLRRAE